MCCILGRFWFFDAVTTTFRGKLSSAHAIESTVVESERAEDSVSKLENKKTDKTKWFVSGEMHQQKRKQSENELKLNKNQRQTKWREKKRKTSRENFNRSKKKAYVIFDF